MMTVSLGCEVAANMQPKCAKEGVNTISVIKDILQMIQDSITRVVQLQHRCDARFFDEELHKKCLHWGFGRLPYFQ